MTTPSANPTSAGIASILKSNNYSPPTQAGATPAPSWRDLVKSSAPVASPPAPDTNTIGADDAKQVLAGGQKIGSAITEGAAKFNAAPDVQKGDTIGTAIGKEAGKTGALLETGLGAASGAVQSIFAPFTAIIQKLSQSASDNPDVQKFANSPIISSILDASKNAAAPLNQWAQANPEAAKNLADALNVGGALAGSEAGGNAINADLGEGANVLKGAAQDAHSAISDALSTPIKSTENAAPALEPKPDLTDKIRTYFAQDNVDPRLAASANRMEDPVSTYQTYAKQAEGAVKDVKQDAPIASVGEHIGDAYDKVASMRRLVGKNMADELSKVKDTPINISAASSKIKADLFEPNSITLKPEIADKMTSFDKEQLGQYYGELSKLGDNPSAAQVDSFLSKIPRELDVAKAAKNITDTTNAERIIKENLAELRDSFGKQPGFSPYVAARKAYANLSDFLEEGGKYLGAKTQTGDFARDASVAKSAAESILSGGKKDWLVKLENLTGYKGLDDATLAIQAMTDAGDKRGLSLFKTLGPADAIHPVGGLYKALQFVGSKVAGKVLGSSADQTTAFLKSLAKPGATPPASGAQ